MAARLPAVHDRPPDDPIFAALAGDDIDSAIADKVWNPDDEEWEITGNRFDPDLSSELYITNGDALDDAYRTHKILGYTPEGTQARDTGVSGFEFEDDEEEIELEFRRHLLFSLDLAESAADPAQPRVAHGQHGAELPRRPLLAVVGRPAARPGHGQARRSAPSR